MSGTLWDHPKSATSPAKGNPWSCSQNGAAWQGWRTVVYMENAKISIYVETPHLFNIFFSESVVGQPFLAVISVKPVSEGIWSIMISVALKCINDHKCEGTKTYNSTFMTLTLCVGIKPLGGAWGGSSFPLSPCGNEWGDTKKHSCPLVYTAGEIPKKW